MMPRRAFCAFLGLGFGFLAAGIGWTAVPRGWVIAGTAPNAYDFSIDSTTARSGHSSALIASKPEAARGVPFGTLLQTISANRFRGSRCRFSGYLKTDHATRAQLWMRVDGNNHQVLTFDNMDSRPVTGTTSWHRYEIVLDVPPDAVSITYGFLLVKTGKVWADDFKLEVVDSTVPVTATDARIPDAPVNMDFEEGAESSASPAQPRQAVPFPPAAPAAPFPPAAPTH